MNVNSIKVNNNNNNNYDINTNNICQSHKYIKFGASNNDYITLKNKDEEKSAKRKRTWIIASVCTVGLAIVAGICYFNGKKVNKTVNKEKIQEKLPKINEKSLDTYIKDLNDQKVNHKKLAQNITELNNLLKNNPDEEIAIKIIDYINSHFVKIIKCKNMEISERIQYLDDYLRFTQSYFNGAEYFDEICDTIKANKNLLESKSKISKDIEANNKSLKNILQSKASIEYKKEFIEKLLEVTENNNIDTILNTISNNTTIDNKDISSIENSICGNILTISTHNNPSLVMTYLHDLSFKNIKNTDTKIDNALLTYGIITQNKIITLIKNLSSNDKLKNYTLDNDKLIYKTDNKTYTFDFNNNSYKV